MRVHVVRNRGFLLQDQRNRVSPQKKTLRRATKFYTVQGTLITNLVKCHCFAQFEKKHVPSFFSVHYTSLAYVSLRARNSLIVKMEKIILRLKNIF